MEHQGGGAGCQNPSAGAIGQIDAGHDQGRARKQGEVDGLVQHQPAEKDAADRNEIDEDRCTGGADCADPFIIPEKSEDRSEKAEIENADPIRRVKIADQAGETLHAGRDEQRGGADDAGVCDCGERREVLHDNLADQRVGDPARDTAEEVNVSPSHAPGEDRKGISPGDDDGCAGQTEEDARHLFGIQPLPEEEGGQQRNEDRIGGHDQGGTAGGDRLHAEKEKDVVSEDPRHAEKNRRDDLMPPQAGDPPLFHNDDDDQEKGCREKPQKRCREGTHVLGDNPGRHEGAAPEDCGQDELAVDDHEYPRIIKKPASPGETTGAH
jgi:hypothetical protein